MEQIGPDIEVITMVIPAISKGKRKYVKRTHYTGIQGKGKEIIGEQ